MSEGILALDLGTSATKVLIVDREGSIVARERLPHATHRPEPGAAEQNPYEWWLNLTRAVPAITPDIRITAIGVTGQMHGLVLHGAGGSPLGNALIWEDRRSASTLLELLSQLAPGHPTIAPGYQTASWHWLRRARPDVTERVHRILLPKDEIVHRLTGRHVTDPSDAVGTGWYDVSTGSWNQSVIDAAGARADQLPEIVPAGSIAGRLCDATASQLALEPGIPVVVAGGDAAVGALGAGATRPDSPLVMLSTGCQVLQPAATRPDIDAWPSANPAGLPAWLRVATTLNGGNVVRWARETLGGPAVSDVDDLLFLPYLHGERTADLGDDPAGAFIGLRSHHTRADMARAAIDGIAFALVDAFAGTGGELGIDMPVIVGGGGVRDDVWVAAIANALGRPLDVIDEGDLSAWGAARSTGTALGWIDPAAEPNAWRPTCRRVSPTPSAAASANDRLLHFRDVARRLYGAGRKVWA